MPFSVYQETLSNHPQTKSRNAVERQIQNYLGCYQHSCVLVWWTENLLVNTFVTDAHKTQLRMQMLKKSTGILQTCTHLLLLRKAVVNLNSVSSLTQTCLDMKSQTALLEQMLFMFSIVSSCVRMHTRSNLYFSDIKKKPSFNMSCTKDSETLQGH